VNEGFKHCHAHCTVMLYNDCISHVNLNNGKCLFLCGMGYTACLVYNACDIAKSVLYMPCTFDFISCWTYQGVECTHCLIAVNYLLDCHQLFTFLLALIDTHITINWSHRF